MSSDKPQRVRRILELALSLPTGERAGRLAEACAGDSELQHEIEALLTLYERSPRPAADPSPFSSPTTFSPDSPDAPPGGLTLPSVVRTPTPSGVATSWGGFVLIEELGRGGFGVVHRGWDANLKRDVALKIIDARRLPGISEDTLLREGQLMARVRHPNVVTVFSAQRIGPEVGLTMEYIKGRTLSMLIAEDGPLSAHEAALIGMTLCDALTAVHRLGLVHRDLKASNVMREHGGRIVLMDFGAGRELGASGEGRVQVLGTPVYMAPEILLGSRGTTASDLYSLGVLLYNLVTADYPVRGARIDEIRLSHLAGERVSLAERRPELPGPFVDAVEKALAREPTDRPQSAVAFKRALADAMPHLPPDSGGRRRRRQSPTSPKPVPAAVPLTTSHIGQGVGPLQAFAIGVGAFTVLATGLGFMTSGEFDAFLGRTGDFAAEAPWSYPVWGVRSVFGSAIYILLGLAIFNVAELLARLAGRAVPPLGKAARRLIDASKAWMRGVGLEGPTAVAQTLSLVGVVGLGTIVWKFHALLSVLTQTVNDAPAREIAILSGANEPTHLLYRRSCELVIVVLGAGLIRLDRQWRAGKRAKVTPLAATGALIVVAFFLLVMPWRLLFNADFPEATVDGRACYVIGERAAELLVHCPSVAPPRNIVIARSEGRVKLTRQISNLFDAYTRAPAVREDRR